MYELILRGLRSVILACDPLEVPAPRPGRTFTCGRGAGGAAGGGGGCAGGDGALLSPCDKLNL